MILVINRAMYIRKFCLPAIFYLFISLFTGNGQKVIIPEIRPADARFDNFLRNEEEAGLAATSIFQDKKGFIWYGTEFGLNRFDGISFKTYGLGNSDSSLMGFCVYSVFEDSEGTIWAGTAGALNGINPVSGKIAHFVPDTNDFASRDNSIRFIKEDRNGLLWLITERDIFNFNKEKEAFARFPLDPSAWQDGYKAMVFEKDWFLEDRAGRIWVGTNAGLYRYDGRSWTRIFPADRDFDKGGCYKVNCVREDDEGNIWIATEAFGLLKISDGKKGSYEVIRILPDNVKPPEKLIVTSVLPESKNKLWIFYNSTLVDFNTVTGESKSYLFSDKPFVPGWGNLLRIDKMFRNKDGSLWLIYIGAGFVLRFDPAKENLRYYQVPRWVEFDCIRDNTENFWFASVAQTIFRLVTDTLPFMTKLIPNSDFVHVGEKQRICQDENGDLWLALSGGVFKIRNPDMSPELKLEKIELPDNKGEPGSVMYDKKGNLWFGLSKGIIFKYDPSGKSFRRFDLPQGSFPDNDNFITLIAEDSQGNTWFAVQNEGLFKLPHKGNTIIKTVRAQELSGSNAEPYIIDFMIDKNDELWLSTLDGLFRMDKSGKTIRNYTGFESTGRTYGSFYLRIVEDGNKNIWVLNSLLGPYLLDRDNDIFKKPEGLSLSSEYGFTDLLPDDRNRLWIGAYGTIITVDLPAMTSRHYILPQKSGEIHSLLLNSGKAAFVVNNKLFIFPEKAPLNRNIPPVYISGLSVNGTEFNKLFPDAGNITDLKKADLRFHQNNLKFEISVLNYTDPRLNKCKYFMKGIDKDTVLTSAGLMAEYKQMPPGRYKFWVTGSNNDGLWNPSGVSLDIRIRPPWYASVAAWIVYAVLFLFFIVSFIRMRTYKLKKDKKRLEAIVKERTEELEVKNRQLAEVDRIKTHFFTDISHEIRTPLSLIIGPLETISKEEILNSRISGMMEIMKRNAQRLMQLVNQLLDISRLDSGRMKISLVREDIVKCLKILVYEFLSAAESKQIKYIAYLPEKDFITWFDRDKVEKIVSNLLSNAFKYTPVNGTIEFSMLIEDPDKQKDKPVMTIRVTDSGPGIEKEHLSRIFDRFFRVEGRNEAENHGTGIGLSLTQEFVSLLHGEISVNSEKGKGSEFVVSFPVGKDHLSADEYVIIPSPSLEPERPDNPVLMPYSVSERKTRNQASEAKVLVIEDNEDLRNFIRESLSDAYQILGAENGRIGLNTAFTMMPDIIITDIMMPDIDGIKLCTTLKNDERTSHIPVIMLTAKATTDDKLDGLRSGADDYIFKPFIVDELKARISNLLQTREKLKLKYQNAGIPEAGSKQQLSVDDRFIEKVVTIINENIPDFEFDVSVLHEQLGMSRMHLSRKLKILTGSSPHILIRNLRLRKAAELLSRHSGNITEIAYSVGFSNPSGFTKAFREYFGVSPKNYSKQ